MDIRQLQTEDNRRSVLWYLLYDSDHELSDTMIGQCFEMQRKNISSDGLKTQIAWLSEQQLVTVSNIGSTSSVALTDRGLEVAKGIVNAIGVRDLRPSERAEIQADKG